MTVKKVLKEDWRISDMKMMMEHDCLLQTVQETVCVWNLAACFPWCFMGVRGVRTNRVALNTGGMCVCVFVCVRENVCMCIILCLNFWRAQNIDLLLLVILFNISLYVLPIVIHWHICHTYVCVCVYVCVLHYRNWCAYVVTRTISCVMEDGVETYVKPEYQRCAWGQCSRVTT